MAYIQKPGGPLKQKTGHGMGPILQKIAGTEAQQKTTPNFFSKKLEELQNKPVTNIMENFRNQQNADKEARATGDFEKIAQYDRLVNSNSAAVKNDIGEFWSYGKGSAKAGDTSAETMTLRQNQGQLPGEKGFKGGTDDRGTTIFPDIKGNLMTGGKIPQENQMSGENYAGNTSKTYYKSDKPGALGKLETLASGQTGNKSSSAVTESFGLMDQFNQTMGGTRNASRVGRDNTGYANSMLDMKPRANTLSGSGTRSDADYSRRMMDLTTKGDKNLSGFSGSKAFANEAGQKALANNDTASLLSMARGAGAKGEDAVNYLEANIQKKTDASPNKGGYESTYKQKYDYPTDVNYNNTKNAQGETELGKNTYSGPDKTKFYSSPKQTQEDNLRAAKLADSSMSLSDFLTKGKSKYFSM